MNIPDDPTLPSVPGVAGVAVHFSKRNFSETEFLRQQLAAVEAHVQRFPAEERELRALAWIEANARQYRQQWQLQAAANGRHLQARSFRPLPTVTASL